MIQELEKNIASIQKEIERIKSLDQAAIPVDTMIKDLHEKKKELVDDYRDHLTPSDRVYLARHLNRPKAHDFINYLIENFIELHGDRNFADDDSIIGGIGMFEGRPVTVIGTHKGACLADNLQCNFGMPNPEGYRKALRLMKQAEKFHRPIITFIDTPGAYPGIGAEERGQGEAIARNLFEMSRLTVPVIAVFTGEGGSGGALALGVANRIVMLENAIFSILSPEGFASILWKDSSRSVEATLLMKLTARDLYEYGIVDDIIEEPISFDKDGFQTVYDALRIYLQKTLAELCLKNGSELARERYAKFREIGR